MAKRLRTTKRFIWPRNGTELGWSDLTFRHLLVAKKPRGSLQPNKWSRHQCEARYAVVRNENPDGAREEG